MSALLNDVGAITLFTEDLAASKSFYRDIFGLEILVEDEQAVAFGFGNTIINVLKVEAAGELIGSAVVGDRDAGSRFQLTIWVDDADATYAELTARGLTFLNGPMDRPWGQRTAAFADPAGHVWEIAQTLPRPQG